MGIVIPPELETRLRAHAEAEGPTVKAYIERLVSADEQQKQNLQIWRWKDSVQVDCYTRILTIGKTNIGNSMSV